VRFLFHIVNLSLCFHYFYLPEWLFFATQRPYYNIAEGGIRKTNFIALLINGRLIY